MLLFRAIIESSFWLIPVLVAHAFRRTLRTLDRPAANAYFWFTAMMLSSVVTALFRFYTLYYPNSWQALVGIFLVPVVGFCTWKASMEVRAAIVRTEAAKSDFVWRIAHDLRTPCSSLILAAQILERNTTSEFKTTYAKLFSLLRRAQVEFNFALDGVLTYASIDEDLRSRKHSIFDANETIDEAVKTQRKVLEAGKAILFKRGKTKLLISAFPDHFKCLAAQMINNATKNAETTVIVKTSCSNGEFVMTVGDDGALPCKTDYSCNPFSRVALDRNSSNYGVETLKVAAALGAEVKRESIAGLGVVSTLTIKATSLDSLPARESGVGVATKLALMAVIILPYVVSANPFLWQRQANGFAPISWLSLV